MFSINTLLFLWYKFNMVLRLVIFCDNSSVWYMSTKGGIIASTSYHIFPVVIYFKNPILIPFIFHVYEVVLETVFANSLHFLHSRKLSGTDILNFLLQVPSHVMLGIPKHDEAPATPRHPLSAMGDACSRMDLTAIHQILVMTHYKDDEGTNEVNRCCLQVAN